MGCPIHGHPAMACEHCEAVYARAFTNARAEGYAEAVADVVAWLRARAGGLRSHTYGQDDERAVLERVMDGIEDACHVGAAKKGGE
jgi:hypothetical protein